MKEHTGEQQTLSGTSISEAVQTVEHSFFSTAGLDNDDEKIEIWRDSTRFIFDAQPDKPTASTPFFADIESYHLGSLVTSICSTVATTWLRSPLDAARNGVDHFLVQFYIQGKCLFSDTESSTLVQPGDILVLDASRKIHSRTSALKNFTLWVPRTLLEPMVADPDSLHGMIIPAEEPRAIILRSYLMSLHEQAPAMTLPQASTLTQPTMELLASTLDLNHQDFETFPDAAVAGSLITIKRYINQHLNRDTLTPDSIAQALRISRSTLYRVCAPLGGIQQYIRQQRLSRVLSNLSDKNMAHLSITQIASLWGFNDPSSFNRIFKREFGVTPSAARSQQFVLADRDYKASLNDQFIGDRQFAHWLTQQL